jgi:hypothetical protein
MKTTDIFKRSSAKINESIEKVFGKKINLESFTLDQLQDARNKLRTQISQVRGESAFNETLENEAFTQAQWMLDAINAELAERDEHIVTQEDNFSEGFSSEADMILHKMARNGDFDEVYDAMGWYLDKRKSPAEQEVGQWLQDQAQDISSETGLHLDDDMEDIISRIMDRLEQDYGDGDFDEPEGSYDSSDDAEALASAGHGSDEDYGEFPESAPPTAKGERMVKHIKKGYAKDGKLTDKEKSIAYATAWKQHNKDKNESVNTGDNMTKLKEGEIQQASAIVNAKTMVDRVGRWIEELSGMENDTLLQLGDSIRDEMGSEQAKNFISAVAPAIQQALENLKATRETLATGVRQLTGEEQGAEMLGAEPGAEGDMGGDEFGGEAGPDMMNAGGDEGGDIAPAEPTDDFGASDAAAGGLEAAGREKRESIERGNSLLRVLAG